MSLRMRHTALSLAILCTLAMALVIGFQVPTSEAVFGCRCPSAEQAWQTLQNPQWGMGPTCQDALDDAEANAIKEAHRVCGSSGLCDLDPNPIIVTPCNFDGTQWKADVNVRFKCFLCLNEL